MPSRYIDLRAPVVTEVRNVARATGTRCHLRSAAPGNTLPRVFSLFPSPRFRFAFESAGCTRRGRSAEGIRACKPDDIFGDRAVGPRRSSAQKPTAYCVATGKRQRTAASATASPGATRPRARADRVVEIFAREWLVDRSSRLFAASVRIVHYRPYVISQ